MDKLNDIIREEYRKKVKTDGIIIINANDLIKVKNENELTVDLRYDIDHHLFLDANKNVYIFEDETEIKGLEILNLINNNDDDDDDDKNNSMLSSHNVPRPESPKNIFRPISPTYVSSSNSFEFTNTVDINTKYNNFSYYFEILSTGDIDIIKKCS